MSPHTILAIDPTMQGFAFAVLEGEDFLFDWGLAHVKAPCITERLDSLILRYLPDVLVLENPDKTHRRQEAQAIIRRLASWALRQDVPVTLISRTEIAEHFRETGHTKHAIAEEIVRRFPELAARIPKKRRAWDSEPERMSIYDALSFALTVRDRGTPCIEF